MTFKDGGKGSGGKRAESKKSVTGTYRKNARKCERFLHPPYPFVYTPPWSYQRLRTRFEMRSFLLRLSDPKHLKGIHSATPARRGGKMMGCMVEKTQS